MTDLKNLKAIAERCKALQPLRFMQSYGALYIRNDNGIVFDVHQNRSFPDFMAQNKDYADLVLAANPAAVLELINERSIAILQLEIQRDIAARRHEKIEKLKAENERLELENEDTLKKYEEAVEGFTKLSAEVLDLRQQLAVPSDVLADCEAMRLDAERYRWLILHAEEIYVKPSRSHGVNLSVDSYKAKQSDEVKETVDQEIDAAMSKDSPNA